MTDNEILDLVVVGECPLDVLMDWSPPIARPGGTCYSSCAASALGARVGIVSDVGKDMLAGQLTQVASMGVDVSGIEVVDCESIVYEISNCAEIVPQNVYVRGIRSRTPRSTHIPQICKGAKGLLVYPYQMDVVLPLIEEIKTRGGHVYFDLQHDVTNLSDWHSTLGRSDVVFASSTELIRNTGQANEQAAVNHVLGLGVPILVVKHGINGSVIYKASGSVEKIPAFLASFQATIGAGDVYNAVFALAHSAGSDTETAGKRAALASSIFIEHVEFSKWTHALQQIDLESHSGSRTPISFTPEDLAKNRIYIAGHFQSLPHREWVDRVTLALECRDLPVFSPYRDAGLLTPRSLNEDRYTAFEADLNAIRSSSIVVALLDGLGRGGVSFELGYAYSLGIPIFGVLTDNGIPISNMLMQACEAIYPNLPQLINGLYEHLSMINKVP